MTISALEDKILTRDEAAAVARSARAAGRRVVFTNGCFDILHLGHVRYLTRAKSLGDVLIVGVNADSSVRRLAKGPDRPLNPARARAEVVAALAAVDHVVIFEEDTPLDLILCIRPDVLVKGGDWPADRIVGAAEVLAAGGEVHSLPWEEGFSTTALIAKIRKGTDVKTTPP